MVYDAPKAKGNFAQRLKLIEKSLTDSKSQYVVAHKHVVCTGLDHLNKELDRVTAENAEGVMIKDPSC